MAVVVVLKARGGQRPSSYPLRGACACCSSHNELLAERLDAQIPVPPTKRCGLARSQAREYPERVHKLPVRRDPRVGDQRLGFLARRSPR